jgi:hypothetical protein
VLFPVWDPPDVFTEDIYSGIDPEWQALGRLVNAAAETQAEGFIMPASGTWVCFLEKLGFHRLLGLTGLGDGKDTQGGRTELK